MKKVISVFLAVLMLVTMVPLAAFAEDDILNYLTYEINNGEVTITDCDETIFGDVIIPDTIQGYPVTTIGDYAFSYCQSIASVTIPNGVTIVGTHAFFYCHSLNSVIIGKSVTVIEHYAFYDCENLSIITIGNNVKVIGDYAFSQCDSLVNIKIPDSVTTIGEYAFYGCDMLTNIKISDSVTLINDFAFFSCNNLESIIIDDNNENYSSDEHGILFNKDKTELIQYPIGNSRVDYIIPDSVISLSPGAFHSCGNLENITIQNSVITIGAYAFYACDSLESVIIPDSVTSIGAAAFIYCHSLNSVTIGDSVTIIGEYAFYDCDSLAKVFYTGTEEQWNTIEIGSDNKCLTNANIIFNSTNSQEPEKPITPENPDSSGKDDSDGFKDYQAHYGVLESVVWTVVTNGNEDPWISEIVVDGKRYQVQKNLLKTTMIENYINDDVAFATKNGEIVFIEPVALIGDYYVHSYLIEDLRLIYCDGKILELYGETFDLEQTVELYTYPCCGTRTQINTSNDEGLLEFVLSEIPEYEMSVQSIKLTLDNTDVISFNGQKTIEIPVSGQLVVGAAMTNTVPVTISRYHDMDINEKYEKINVNIEVNAKRNNTEIKWSGSQAILVKNGNFYKPEEKPNKPEGSSETTSDEYANIAAVELENISGAAAMDARLTEIFTWEQLDAIGSMLLCEIAMATAPEKTFSEILSEKIIEKVFKIDTGLFGVRNDEVSVTVAVDSDYGEVKVKFTCDFQQYILSGSAFGYFGSINYEIVGGKGKNKLPKSFAQDGFAGTLTAVDMSAFCESAYDLALSELKNAYQMSWGDDADKAADIIFGTSVNKILSKTKYNSVSGLVWEALVYPGKKIKIECPVNVFVYNKNNELVASVENNEVTLINPNVQITVNGDIKEIVVFDETYSITYEAIADGNMRITVTEYGTSENLLSTTQINDILLTPGRTYTQTINNEYFEDSDYSVTSSTGIIYEPDVKLLSMHTHKPNGQRTIGKDPVCNENGWEYCMCEICDEWYRNTLESTELHTPGEWEVVTEAQVGAEGLEQQKCTVCGEVLDERVIPALPDVTYIVGDVNGDGRITAADARLLLRISAKLDKSEDYNLPLEAFDVTGDSKITAADARRILRIAAKLE